VPFEASDRFAVGFAAFALSGDVEGTLRVTTDLADGEHVDGVVELAVAAAVAAVAVCASGGHRNRSASGDARELRIAGEAVNSGDLADQLGGDDHADPALCQQLRCDPLDECGELVMKFVDRPGKVADPPDLIARDRRVLTTSRSSWKVR
jgi:hypothetical protein